MHKTSAGERRKDLLKKASELERGWTAAGEILHRRVGSDA
jgi:hypothetical protein